MSLPWRLVVEKSLEIGIILAKQKPSFFICYSAELISRSEKVSVFHFVDQTGEFASIKLCFELMFRLLLIFLTSLD